MEPTKFDMKYAAVRRAIIEQRFSKLNDKQREAVYQTEGPLLILAGAGSGKTTVLINRIINILKFGDGLESELAPDWATEDDLLFLTEYLTDPKPEHRARAEHLCAMNPARPWQVIAITFTNKAARELRERLEFALGDEEAASAVWAYTFHTACLRILRKHVDLLGFESAFTIYDEDDKKRVILNVMKKLDLDPKNFDPRTVMGMISRAKDKLMTPRQFSADAAGDYFREKVADVYRDYEKAMKKACALDFDDIIMKTVLLLQNNPEVLEYYQRQFRYVLVDEYQDTNYAQYVLTSLLAGYYENICVVGDDDQSIYKFRGATITNILEFEKQFKDAKTIRLEQNYRSTGNILNAANEVIRNNVGRKGKELWTARGDGAKIRLHRSDSQEGEAAYIADTIREGVEQGRKWGDFAVLYRNNVLSDNIAAAFIRAGIPYRVYKGRDFFSRAEVKDMTLRISEKPDSRRPERTEVTVYYNALRAVSLSGAAATFVGTLDAAVLDVTVNRKASLTAKLDVKDLKMEQTGYSTANLSGSGRYLTLYVSTGKVAASDLEVMSAEVNAQSKAEVSLWITDRFVGKTTTNARISYKGDPKIVRGGAKFMGGEINRVE